MSSELYDRCIPTIVRRIGEQPAEVQAIRVAGRTFVAIPAEFFCAPGLAIRQRCHPADVQVVGFANGMVGYVPTDEALGRGGYETTFGPTSWMGRGAAGQLVEAAVRVVSRSAAAHGSQRP